MLVRTFKKGVALCLSFFYSFDSYAEMQSGFLEIGSGIQNVRYSETSSSSFELNKESGSIPAIFVKGGMNYQKVSVFTRANFAKSKVDYQGHTQSLQPLVTDTDTTRAEHSLGSVYQLKEWLDLEASISHYEWDREIEGTNMSLPLDEYYTWRTLKLGAEVLLFNRLKDQFSLKVTGGKLYDERLKVDLSNLGYGKPVISLKGKSYRSVDLEYSYNWSSSSEIKFNAQYTHTKFAESDSITVRNGFTTITIREPQSETTVIGFNLGLVFNF
jgi:hypothetical protein